MTNQLDLTAQQIATLNQIKANGTTNFPAGYKYISELIEDRSSVDSYTKVFFSGAAEVPAILLQQFRIFYKGEQPVGVAFWALADEIVAKRIDAGDVRLTPADGRVGRASRLWTLLRRLAARRKCARNSTHCPLLRTRDGWVLRLLAGPCRTS
ncbi:MULTISPECIES: toxin-activating lysine-acyltransferase [Bradyrhizobium]|uniref:RTX toxin-activating lysine-acyltransferase n=1 Tax=Bradyrhizobium diazoefficiens TaxID=1355477 RepID=A0A810AJ89_9BRAD|nr:toxin-activating lysine-acyltransferase [Bradyrhizobium diazoefficiens]MBP1065921.1 hypothetical protein [Bradyrhizobium japonicum]AND89393.1 hypothetical protein AAV28_17495 [Bradyrhizobium diazoefficiens USDA 110]MBP1093308.1 hypothetical protein [Bradyrhizobium japonicum]QJS40975.1 toxin-activating lysine-acyltransferase [Bradyrhizobium diazoefficiens]QLD44185.1 toxin-activating lysine-acyltransferase [Bradyrhizobium diazoefficiens]